MVWLIVPALPRKKASVILREVLAWVVALISTRRRYEPAAEIKVPLVILSEIGYFY